MRCSMRHFRTPGPGRISVSAIPGDYQFRAIAYGHPVQRAWHEAKLRLIQDLALPGAGESVLDAGCGSGVAADFLARTGARVVAVDMNEEAVDFGTRHFGRPGLDFVCTSLKTFQGGPFHRIYLMECIEHLAKKDVRHILQRLVRLTVPDGQLLLTTPNYRSAWPWIERFLDIARWTPRMRNGQHLTPMTPVFLGKQLRAAGWNVLEMGSFNGIAPFLGVFSLSLARLAALRERKRRGVLYRNLLYALCKPDRRGG